MKPYRKFNKEWYYQQIFKCQIKGMSLLESYDYCIKLLDDLKKETGQQIKPVTLTTFRVYVGDVNQGVYDNYVRYSASEMALEIEASRQRLLHLYNLNNEAIQKAINTGKFYVIPDMSLIQQNLILRVAEITVKGVKAFKNEIKESNFSVKGSEEPKELINEEPKELPEPDSKNESINLNELILGESV